MTIPVFNNGDFFVEGYKYNIDYLLKIEYPKNSFRF